MIAANREDELEGADVSTTPDPDVTDHQTRAEDAGATDGVVVRGALGDDRGVLSVGHRTWLATYEPIAGPEYVAMGLASGGPATSSPTRSARAAPSSP